MRDLHLFRSGVLTVSLLVAALTGCGDLGGVDPYEGGTEVQAVGVIDFPSTTSGDFVPGTLRVTTGYELPLAQLQGVLDQRLPGSSVRAVPGTVLQADVSVPIGVTLKNARDALAEELSFTAVDVLQPEDVSTDITLVEIAPGKLADEAPRLTFLQAEDASVLLEKAFGTVVRVTGRLLPPDTEVGPQTTMKVQRIEELGPYLLTATGTLSVLGSKRSCVVLAPDAGTPISLAGAKAAELARVSGSNGGRFEISYRDAGISVMACSGGRQALLVDFTRR